MKTNFLDTLEKVAQMLRNKQEELTKNNEPLSESFMIRKNEVIKTINEIREGEIIELTLSELIFNHLIKIDGAKFQGCSYILHNKYKMVKKGTNPFWGVKDEITKITKYQADMNMNYENGVNNELARRGEEANFEAGEAYYEPIKDSFNGTLVKMKDKPLDINDIRFKVKLKDSLPIRFAFLNKGEVVDMTDEATLKEYKQERTEQFYKINVPILANFKMLKVQGTTFLIE